MSSIQPSSGSNYNPLRTQDNKPTSDAPITGMGKLSGDYGKTSNFFFRKVYDSVAALFSGKYWKGGWFAPKQSGDQSDLTSLSGRLSVGDRESSVNTSTSSVNTSTNSDSKSARTVNTHSFTRSGLDNRTNLGSQENQMHTPLINRDTAEGIQPASSDASVYRGDNKVNPYSGADSEIAIKAEAHQNNQIRELHADIEKLIVAASNPDMEHESKDIRKEPKKELTSALQKCNNGLAALTKSSYSVSQEIKEKLEGVGLEYNSIDNKIELKKK